MGRGEVPRGWGGGGERWYIDLVTFLFFSSFFGHAAGHAGS